MNEDSDLMYRLLVQSVEDYAIYMLTPEGIIANWNAGAQRAKGYLSDEIVGKHFSCFYTPDDQKKGWPAHGLETARNVGRYESEGWRQRKDGTQFWAHVIIERSEERRVGKECRSRCDWSSDVCSSDLACAWFGNRPQRRALRIRGLAPA